MALYQLHFLSLSASYNFSFSSKPKKSHLIRNSHQNPVHGCAIYASSAEKPSRKKKGRSSRAAMSDEDLCKELREVMLVAGLPADCVPLMKELCEHGRTHEANQRRIFERLEEIVREIGTWKEIDDSVVRGVFYTIRKDLANIVRRRGYKVVRALLSASILSDNHRENSSVEDQERGDTHSDEASEFEETHLGSTKGSSPLIISSVVEDHTAETKRTMKNDMPVQIGESSISSIDPVNSVAAYSYQKSELDMNFSGTYREVHALEEENLPGSYRVINHAKNIETNEDLASNMVFAEDNIKTEIDHLKALLHQKQMELFELKQHIEKEKQALNLLQARTQNEIGNVHEVILTKDAELRASKGKLSGLKELLVQFCVNGEAVEVAGSFNGWHKQIRMNLHPSSRTVDLPQVSRVSKLWSTILWLYPGTYEIKFIVDGQWMIDPQREVATNGHITNNVLRVDK